MRSDSSETDSYDEYGYGRESITIQFLEESLCEEENLREVWQEKVEAVLEAKGLSCELKWDEKKMTVRPPPLGDSTLEYGMANCILDKARDALFVLAAGFSAKNHEL